MQESFPEDHGHEISQAEARQFTDGINRLEDCFTRQPKPADPPLPAELGGDKILYNEDQYAFFDLDDQLVNVYKTNSASVDDEEIIVEVCSWSVHVTADLEIPGRLPTLITRQFEIWESGDGSLRPIYTETIKELNRATGRIRIISEVADRVREALDLGDRDAVAERLNEIRQQQIEQTPEVQELEEITGISSTRFTKERFDEIMGLLSKLGPECQTPEDL
jgi:hypothetical protein